MHRHRIRVVGLLLNEKQELLLVLHRHPVTKELWYTPPGGALLEGENIYDAVSREVREESGLYCLPQRVLYIREFIEDERRYHNLEVFIEVKYVAGCLQAGYDPEESKQYIQQVAFMSKEEIVATPVTVHPYILKDQYWRDLENHFKRHNFYLGQQKVGARR